MQTPTDRPYQMCTRTVMDTSDPDIVFDADGVCNHVHEYEAAARETLLAPGEREARLEKIISEVKAYGQDGKYDCLIGLSGGVDSSYVAYLVWQLGLRPLAVHLDNGWDSELAVRNIENIVRRLDIDLHTLVIDWEEFRKIQLAYLRASVVDIEVVSDHAIFASMYRIARKYRVPYVISGTNIVTEFIMPRAWLYHKMDYANLADIYRQYGEGKFRTYPTCDIFKYIYYTGFHRLSPISILNYIDYQKEEAKQTIADELEWRDYGGKHYESIFTKFYQAYILPKKFGIDKRRAHYSTLICSGQMTRDEALEALEEPLYEERELQEELEYILKKFKLTPEQFDEIMKTPPRSHSDFKSDLPAKAIYQRFLARTYALRRAVKQAFRIKRGSR